MGNKQAAGKPSSKLSSPASLSAQSPSASSNMLQANSGKRFKDCFTLGKELGKGNYSTVRLAVSVVGKEECAVKCILKKKLTKEDEDALKIEVKILGAVSHPNIIKLYGFFEEPQDYYIVTELMKGGELFDRIVAKDFYSEGDAQKVVRTVTSCLLYLHDQDIVHRDLKPENILLKNKLDDEDLKIADFGFARYVGSGCASSCGTPGYVAPEIITGKLYGKPVDVWSMGVIMFILLCGYPPFYHKNQAQLFRLIREAKFEFESPYWDNISGTAKDLIKRCLTVDHTKRITMSQVLQHEWITGKASDKDIANVLGELKRFNARRKLRAGIKAAIAAGKMSDLAASIKQQSN
ncbi:hypothetical protein BASA81_003187 [Batrachochytrium salamandrivorans]|nr:hypothetical protein BASA81_003187 [Batrachochytrium salamandrivorans]